jgi:integrase
MTKRPVARRVRQPKAVLTAATRAERKRRRAALGSLLDLRVTKATLRRYVLAYARFSEWMQLVVCLAIADWVALDTHLAAHIAELWEEGEPRPWSNDVCAAVQYFVPGAKGNLGLSWSLCSAWGRRELPCRALPLTLQTLAGMAGGCILAGHPMLAAALIVGFDLIARTNELLSLCSDDVLWSAESPTAVVRFRETKAGFREGVHQSVVVDEPVVLACLKYLTTGLGPGEPLLPLREAAFRKTFSHVAGCLGLLELGLKPYSMRRGGATFLWRSTLSYDAVSHRGRWASISTCRRYVEDGAIAIAEQRLSTHQIEQLAALGDVWRQWASGICP